MEDVYSIVQYRIIINNDYNFITSSLEAKMFTQIGDLASAHTARTVSLKCHYSSVFFLFLICLFFAHFFSFF